MIATELAYVPSSEQFGDINLDGALHSHVDMTPLNHASILCTDDRSKHKVEGCCDVGGTCECRHPCVSSQRSF